MRLAYVVVLAVFCNSALLLDSAFGELILYEGFDYPVGDLAGQNGGFGWNGGWSVSSEAVVQAGSLGYNDGTSSLPTLGNHVLIGGPTGSQSTAERTMFTGLGLSAGTYWMSFVGQRQLPHMDDPNNYARAAAWQLQLQGSSTEEQFSVGKVTTPVSGTVTQTWDVFSVAVANSSDSTGVDQATQILAVMQVIITDDDDTNDTDTVNLWVDPSLDANDPLGTPDAVNGGIEDYLFNGVRLFAGGTSADGEYSQIAIDEIRVGTDLDDVLTGEIVLGDTNGNGVPDPNDLTPIRMNYRQEVDFRSQGDLNGDGVVTFADFRQFKTALIGAGQSLSGLNLQFLTVPEPCSVQLTILGISLALFRRKRKQGRPRMSEMRKSEKGTGMAVKPLVLALLLMLGIANSAQAVISITVTDDGYAANDERRSPETNGDRNEASAFFEVRHYYVDPTVRKRIGYIKYAVSGLDPIIYDSATLSGEFAGNFDGAGTWNVYGLNDGEENLDDDPNGNFGEANWTEAGLSYSKGLGVDPNVPIESPDLGLDLTEITLLGTITLPGDQPFQSDPNQLPLGNFLSLDTNGVVTFLIADSGMSGIEWRVQAMENESGPGVLLNFECDDGDANCDGSIDVELDLAAIAAHFRQDVVLRSDGDLTSDGFVDFDDFDQWKRNYPGPLTGLDLSFLKAVPEPSTLLIALVAVPWLSTRRYRFRS